MGKSMKASPERRAYIRRLVNARKEREKRLDDFRESELEHLGFSGLRGKAEEFFEHSFLAMSTKQRNATLRGLRHRLAMISSRTAEMEKEFYQGHLFSGTLEKAKNDMKALNELASRFDALNNELHAVFTNKYFSLANSTHLGQKGSIGANWHTTTHGILYLKMQGAANLAGVEMRKRKT